MKRKRGEERKRDFYRRAEKLTAASMKEMQELTETDVQKLIHELQAHQAELEMQNEKLRRAQLEMEESRSKYADLFDFAPVGYFTLNAKDLILEANLTATALLGTERNRLIKQRFSQYIHNEDRESFYYYKERLLKTKTRLACEVRMLGSNGTQFNARLESIALFDEKSGGLSCFRIALLDTTDQKRAEELLKNTRKELEVRVLERTADLLKANEALHIEIKERRRIEGELVQSFRHLAKKNLYETIVRTVTQSVHQSINPQDVFENAVEAMSNNIDGADGVSIYIIEGKEAVMRAQRGYPESFVHRVSKIPYPKDLTWQAILDEKPRYCADVDQEAGVGRVGKEIGTKSYLSMPIRFGGKTVGTICVNSFKKNVFSEEELSLLEMVAGQIETAISNAQQAETLRESEEKYRTLVESSYDLIIETSIDGRFLYLNSKHKDVLGYEPGELIDRSIFEHIHPEDRSAVMAEFIRAIKTTSSGHAVFRFRHKNGDWRWLESTGRPFHAARGDVGGLIVSRDITERKRVEEALRESEEKYRNLFENIPTGVYRTTPDGRIIMANPALVRMLGYSSFDELASRNLEKEGFGAPYLRSQFKEFLEREGEVKGLESAWLKRDGTVIFVRESTITIRGEDGTVLYYEGTVEDITERKWAEQELRKAHDELEVRVQERTKKLSEANKALENEIAERRKSDEQLHALAARLQSTREEERTRIAREIHDELGQMLTGLKMDLSWLIGRVSGSDDKSRRSLLLNKMQVMSDFVDTTIGVVRRIATELRPGVLDDLGLVAAIEWQVQDFQKRTGIVCEFISNVEDTSLNQERSTVIFRVFQEALTNVARHADATEVKIRLKEEDNKVTLEIEDNGRGITEKEISGSKSLGLLGMKERALIFGGEIGIARGESGGTKVNVTIPLGGGVHDDRNSNSR